VAEFLRLLIVLQKEFLIVFFYLCEMGHRHEQIGTVVAHLALHVALSPPGIRIAEADPEMVMGSDPGEQFRFMDGIPDLATYASGIVKDQRRRHPPMNSKISKSP